jgi:PAS domain S-box-containing protein
MPDHGRDGADKRFTLGEMPVPMVYASYRIIRDCNAAFTELFGFTRDGIVGHSFAQLYPKLDDFVRIGEIWNANLTAGQVYEDERIMRDVGGRRFWCRVSGRTRTPADPLAEAVYCFQPLNRVVRTTGRVSLSDRQHQILARVAQGKTSVDIAAETGLSRRTVESHRARLMKAIGVRNTAELIAWFSSSQK